VSEDKPATPPESPLPAAWDGPDAQNFDSVAAVTFIGKSVLIGVTYVGADGQADGRFQMHGIIEKATPKGIEVALKGTREGQRWTMPPQLSGLVRAEPGKYGLKDTAEVVENPDFIAVWTVAKPPPGTGKAG
jgi:hypothetical protein